MTDTHIELYKKYRPRKWSEVIGQDKTRDSLRKAVLSNKLPTAYGFFGKAGCGKTSVAFIMAKAINCLNRGEKGDPCNECDVCVNIDAGSQLGVNYISMANKGSVDDVRELVKQARMRQPVNKQVWILDEAHNLHKSAWDALLIPIEEDSMPSLFIFCSTEIERIPKTILSRIQQRRFNLVDASLMYKYLGHIAKKEGLNVTKEDLQNAVQSGRGSVRTSLSSLETIVETGAASESYNGQLLEALSTRDLSKCLKVIAEANAGSEHPRDLAETLFEDLRDLLLAAAGVDSKLIGTIPVTDVEQACKNLLGKRGITYILDEIGGGLNNMSLGADARITLETAIVKSFMKLSKLERTFKKS